MFSPYTSFAMPISSFAGYAGVAAASGNDRSATSGRPGSGTYSGCRWPSWRTPSARRGRRRSLAERTSTIRSCWRRETANRSPRLTRGPAAIAFLIAERTATPLRATRHPEPAAVSRPSPDVSEGSRVRRWHMTTMTPTITRQTITDQELLALERQYWDALKDGDARTVRRLTAEDSTTASPRGVNVLSPDSIGQMVENPPHKLVDYGIDPQSTRITRICDDAVAIAYGLHEDLQVDGKPVKLDVVDTSIWKQTDDGWKCVLHTESIKGDPYGRDRIPGGYSARR